MKKVIAFFAITLFFISCNGRVSATKKVASNLNQEIIGTWKLVYGEIREQDSIQIKDLSTSEFIKIINATHFAFFNQSLSNSEDFYGGAGSYTLSGTTYSEQLNFIGNKDFRGQHFTFQLELKGDTLIQTGMEEIEKANLKRFIIEKYIKL